jgi:plastocyanin
MRLVAVLAVTAAAAAFLASSASATVPYQIDITINDKACTLDHPAAPQKLVLFHVISQGKYSHQFKIWGVSSGIIKAGQEGIFKVKFRAPGSYGYTCYNSHALLARGKLKIR